MRDIRNFHRQANFTGIIFKRQASISLATELMRNIFYPALLAIAFLFTGCKTTCDGRGPTEYCELHHEMMETESVERHVTPQPSPEYLQARVKYFIHSYPYGLPEKCKTCIVYICPECVRNEEAWIRSHPNLK
jgi:hypothetical protein